MGKGNSSKVNETQGFMTLWHSNWTICSLLNWFRSKKFPPFNRAFHNNPIIYTAERGIKEGTGQKMGKGTSSKVNETRGSLILGHSNWTICSLLSWFGSKTFHPFSLASHNNPILYTAERGRKGQGRQLGEGTLHKWVRHWGPSPCAFKLDHLQPVKLILFQKKSYFLPSLPYWPSS